MLAAGWAVSLSATLHDSGAAFTRSMSLEHAVAKLPEAGAASGSVPPPPAGEPMDVDALVTGALARLAISDTAQHGSVSGFPPTPVPERPRKRRRRVRAAASLGSKVARRFCCGDCLCMSCRKCQYCCECDQSQEVEI